MRWPTFTDLSSQEDFYLSSALVVELMVILEKMHIVKIKGAFHEEGRLHVVIEQ